MNQFNSGPSVNTYNKLSHWFDFSNPGILKVYSGKIDIGQHISSSLALIASKITEIKYDQIEIIFNEFKNVATQIIRNEQFLPILPIDPSEGTNAQNIDFIAEPNEAFIFNEIIPNSLKIQFYKGLLESNASEHGARMTAMGQATDNAAMFWIFH